MKDYTELIKDYLFQEIETIKKLDIEIINKVINILEEARQRSANIYICGNGGSAATASHIVCDFNKGVSQETLDRSKYRMICLNDNVPTVLAIANDFCYDDIFAVQIEGRIKSEDVLIVISGSGNSANVVKAIKTAKNAGACVIGMTGYNGGNVGQMADWHLHVPINNMQITEDIHMIFNHLMMWVLAYGGR